MYEYSKPGSTWDGSALVYGKVFEALAEFPAGSKVLDVGCGNGHLSGLLSDRGFQSYGVDPSETGIAVARRENPAVSFTCLDLSKDTYNLRDFDAITCIEVIEHVYAPRLLLASIFRVLKPGGMLVLSTPYHGYAKNLAVMLSGRFDRHFDPLWDDGHIKFFSEETLARVLRGTGFSDISIQGLGRVPYLWKTMLAIARKPV
jgi:2-polyprenyl-3-methyl-5-hydroxy-6-metoxy-1,4-benzoquinol methylase